MSETYLLILVVLILFEAVMSLTWNSAYFRHGVVLFHKEAQFRSGHRTLPMSADAIESEFDQASSGQKMLFREVAPGMIGFREKWFNFRFTAFRYSPVMHGIIVTDTTSGKYVVKGIANWTVFFVFAYSIWLSAPHLLTSWNGLILPVALIVISFVIYRVQYRRFEQLLSLVIKE